MRQAERKFITSTRIPDLDNANVGTYMIDCFNGTLITGDTLVSPVFAWDDDLEDDHAVKHKETRSTNSVRAQPKLERELAVRRKEDSRR